MNRIIRKKLKESCIKEELGNFLVFKLFANKKEILFWDAVKKLNNMFKQNNMFFLSRCSEINDFLEGGYLKQTDDKVSITKSGIKAFHGWERIVFR